MPLRHCLHTANMLLTDSRWQCGYLNGVGMVLGMDDQKLQETSSTSYTTFSSCQSSSTSCCSFSTSSFSSSPFSRSYSSSSSSKFSFPTPAALPPLLLHLRSCLLPIFLLLLLLLPMLLLLLLLLPILLLLLLCPLVAQQKLIFLNSHGGVGRGWGGGKGWGCT